jgi:hypothetical protein
MSSSTLLRRIGLTAALAVGALIGPRRADAQTPPPAPVQMLPAVVTRADPLMSEIHRTIADSTELANMSGRERYLRLKQDNRYLEGILKDQDRRIAQLEKRLQSLKEARAKARETPAEIKPDENKELERALDRVERRLPE